MATYLTELPDWARRAVRTWAQAFLGSLLATLSTASVVDVGGSSFWHKALASALLSAGIATLSAIVSGLQNLGEEKGMPALLKGPALPIA